MDLTPDPFTAEDVEAGVRALHHNFYDGPVHLHEEDRVEIVEIVLTAAATKIREAGREDAARPMIDPADVRIVLDQRIGHDHQRPGVWDFDNPPDRAGQPCVECAARKRLRAAIEADQPRTRSKRLWGTTQRSSGHEDVAVDHDR